MWASTPQAPADPIFALTAGYQADSFENKVNLGVGAYRDNEGKPFVLPVVRKVRGPFSRFFCGECRPGRGGGGTGQVTCFSSRVRTDGGCLWTEAEWSRCLSMRSRPSLEDEQPPPTDTSPLGAPRTQAKQILAADESLDHEYLPIAGLPAFVKATGKLIFGADSPAIKEDRVVSCVPPLFFLSRPGG